VAHQVVGPGTHRGSGPREVHTTVDPLGLTISLWMVRCTFEQLSLSFLKRFFQKELGKALSLSENGFWKPM
jgi:hypothetical protein